MKPGKIMKLLILLCSFSTEFGLKRCSVYRKVIETSL